ncbi:telomere-protecting terminal protein Tpg [Streptomyces sp. NPDC001153]
MPADTRAGPDHGAGPRAHPAAAPHTAVSRAGVSPPGHSARRRTPPRHRGVAGDECVRGRPGRRGAEGVHPPGVQERARADALPCQAAQEHQGGRPDAAHLPAHRRTVRQRPDRKARPDLAARLANEVKKRWQPQIRAQARQKGATTGGIVIDTRARIGYTAPIGTTDEDRLRHLTVALPPRYAARLFDAQEQAPATSSSNR